jgi:uncharacterized protein YydD (DUF2326 family)
MEVLKNGTVIRHIPFKSGVNLVLDKADSKTGGNSIGKSTLGRVLDYMFLAKPDDIYLDSEFKKPNPFVYALLEQNEITIKLCFVSEAKKEMVFIRNLPVGEKERTFAINDESVSASDYTEVLSKKIFGNHSSKPSIRNIAPKFVRNSHDKMQNTLSFLDVRTADAVYNYVFPFLFGFTKMELISDKASLDKTVKKLSKRLAAYRTPHKEGALQRMLKPIEKEIQELQLKLTSLNVVGESEKSVKALIALQSKISNLSIEVSKRNLIKDAQEGSISELQSQMATYDLKEIENIYKFALASLPKVHRQFEDVMRFHNTLIEKKVTFISESVNTIANEINALEKEIRKLEKDESAILERIKQPDVMSTLSAIQKQISLLSERKGEIEGSLKAINEAKETIATSNKKLDEIKRALLLNQAELDKNIEIFNLYFSEYSKILYGENYVFSLDFNSDTGHCMYSIDSISPNPEGGKKKGEISAYDLAYIKFAESAKLNRPRFVLHDSIEDVDHIQIRRIFDIANGIRGQYIVSMLRDKLLQIPEEIITECTIFELSDDEKFFLV